MDKNKKTTGKKTQESDSLQPEFTHADGSVDNQHVTHNVTKEALGPNTRR